MSAEESELGLEKFFKKTVLSVLLGGVYFDKDAHTMILFTHRYLLIIFFSVPLAVHFGIPRDYSLWVYIFYPILVGAFFLTMKFVINGFHRFFDKNERGIAKEIVPPKLKGKSPSKKKVVTETNPKEEIVDIEEDPKKEKTPKKNEGKEDPKKESIEKTKTVNEMDEDIIIVDEKRDSKDTKNNDKEKEKENEEIKSVLEIIEESPKEEKAKKKKKKVKKTVIKTFRFVDEFGAENVYEIPEEIEVTASSSEEELDDDKKKTTSLDDDESKKKKKKKKEKEEKKAKQFQFSICGLVIPIFFDRQYLENLFDRNTSIWEVIFAVILSSITSFLHIHLLYSIPFFAMKIFISIVAATSSFTLLKSPQPDGNSFLHFSVINAFSRSFFFSFFAGIYFLLNDVFVVDPYNEVPLYILMLLPIFFLCGLLPNYKTFLIYFFEQIHIHVFGGTGLISIGSVIGYLLIDVFILSFFFPVMYLIPYEYDVYKRYYFIFFMFLLCYMFSKVSSYHINSIIPFIISLFKWKNKRKKNKAEKRAKRKKIYNGIIRFSLNLLIGSSLGLFGIFMNLFYIELYITIPLLIIISFFNHFIFTEIRKFHPFVCLGQLNWTTKRTFKLMLIIIKKMLSIIEIIIMVTVISQNAFVKINENYKWLNDLLCIAFTYKIIMMLFNKLHRIGLASFCAIFFFYFECHSLYNFVFLLFLFTLFIDKLLELYTKLRFIIAYRNFRSISAIFHIVLYPLSFPHLSLNLCLLLYSVIFSTPIIPWLGSNLWVLSYPRAVKFWEKEYKTTRKDTASMSVSQTLISGGGSENFANNLNSVFYEHLTSALKKCKNIFEHFGNLETGDMFIIMNESTNNETLTALVHFVEVGNNFVTFQLRGLEFAGTVCQSKEQEALLRAIEQDTFDFSMLYNQMWYTWKVLSNQFFLKTYNRMKQEAETSINTHENKRLILNYYVFTIAYFVLKTGEKKLREWINNPLNAEIINVITDDYIYIDPFFQTNNSSRQFDRDFDEVNDGVSWVLFRLLYSPFLDLVMERLNLIESKEDKKKKKEKEKEKEKEKDDKINKKYLSEEEVLLVKKWIFRLTIVARLSLYSDPAYLSSLGTSGFSGRMAQQSVISFVENIYKNFTLDFNISNDLWIFNDTSVLDLFSQGLIMSIRLFLDHYISLNFEDVREGNVVFERIEKYHKDIRMYPEKDHKWKESICDTEETNLFTLRKIIDPMKDEMPKYILLQLKKEKRRFNTIKLNKYSIRSMWSAQQNELIFFGNQNTERGSIQQFKNVLRNIINTSADIPVGYPCYISPLTTNVKQSWL